MHILLKSWDPAITSVYQSSKPERPDRSTGYRLLRKYFDSSILNHMDFRKHLDDKRFDLAFEAIDELYCHANTNDLV
jgi:hypothetical protein